jgi:hypothetical protein
LRTLLEVACLNHMYPIKNKLKDYTIMKYFMTSGAFSKDKKPKGDPGEKGAVSDLREAAVTTIYD